MAAKELIIIKKYITFTHNKGSKYELDEYDDDGIHVIYKETKKDGFSVFHKTLKRDKKEWDELCELYPF